MNAEIRSILDFWFAPGMEEKWFVRDVDMDRQIAERFASVYERARVGALDGWAETREGALALTLVLDQFPRNLFRNSPRAFESDQQARILCRSNLARGFDRDSTPAERQFLYLPLMHSEALRDQKDSVKVYEALGDASTLDFAIRHHDIIAQFGCFPHRNEVLGRQNTPEEEEFLKDNPGF
jgi:uncharacterized protein (DUF924 family)